MKEFSVRSVSISDPQRLRQTVRAARNKVDARQKAMKITERMDVTPEQIENSALVKNSVLYKEFLAEREEILRHKWIESEKVGHDIGFEKALLDWIVKYRSSWRDKRQQLSHPD